MIDNKTIINSLPFAIFLKDSQGKYIYANKKFATEAGFSNAAELIGKSDQDMPWRQYAADYAKQEKKILNKKMEHIYQEEQYYFAGKSIVRHTYKTAIYQEAESSYIILGVYDNYGTSNLLEIILNTIPHHIFWKDRYGRFLGCNKEFSQAAGMKPKQLIGKTDHQMPWSALAEKYIADDQQVMRDVTPIRRYEEIQKRHDGSTITALVSKFPLTYSDNTAYGVLGVYTDITDIKLKEEKLEQLIQEARQADLAKSAFISDMSHDIRTPISGIIGLAKKLSEDLSEDTEKALIAADIHCAGEKLMQLCNQILEAAEIGQGVNQKIGISFNIENLINDVIDIMRASIKHKQLQLNIKINITHKTFFGYKTLIHRVLLNLISNAVKFTEKGDITITADTEISSSEITNLKIKVSDTGPGISKAQQKLIFNNFHRGTSSFGSQHKGTGLGLYIVKEFIMQMSGDISLTSEKNKGSCFSISIPLIKTTIQEQENTQQSSSKTCTTSTSYKKTSNKRTLQILLVEDDPVSQRVGKFSFEELSFEVKIATNGKQALNLAKNNYYDYVFLDIGLPDINGTVVAEKIKKLPSYIARDNKIIAITAHLPRNKISALTKSGFSGFIRKPLTSQLITAALNGDKSISCEHQSIFNENIETNSHRHLINSPLPISENNPKEITSFNEADAANEIFNMLLSSLPDTLLDMEHAWRQKNWQLLERLTHRLHSGACYVDLPDLREALRQLELNLQNRKPANIDFYFNNLKIKIKSLINTYKIPENIK